MTCPRFDPSPCHDVALQPIAPLRSVHDGEEWLPIVWCPADFALELFESAVKQLVDHPEYNSTLILRSETLGETVHGHDDDSDLLSHRPVRTIHRRLLPRRPGRDAALEQRCTLYAPANAGDPPCTLVLSPLLAPSAPLPYYHPPVRRLAFRYVACHTPPVLRIEAVVADAPVDPGSRLYRTACALLESLHRYGWGAAVRYRKRVRHDCLVAREAYQDLYLAMRARHAHWVAAWKESTDPLKHVFEDIGIATYLMMLWKESYPDRDRRPVGDDPDHCEGHGDSNDDAPPWAHWPQPPGGFLDLGCGNGLLTHILVSEGYRGHGVDLRARVSWAHYPARTRAALHVHAFDPTRYVGGGGGGPGSDADLHACLDPGRGTFLIGNHADELTPWIPLVGTITRASGYLSIPCCAWSFDERFSPGGWLPRWGDDGDDEAFLDSLNLERESGRGQQRSRYAAYRIWLARLSAWTGWKIECDTLRIPSTRNWAIVGRERLGEDAQVYVQRAHDIVEAVVKRGAFKTRTPEGKKH